MFWHHSQTWVMDVLFLEWFYQCFVPKVKKCLGEKGLTFELLLIIDNVPGPFPISLLHQREHGNDVPASKHYVTDADTSSSALRQLTSTSPLGRFVLSFMLTLVAASWIYEKTLQLQVQFSYGIGYRCCQAQDSQCVLKVLQS